MGIVNLSHDSFYGASYLSSRKEVDDRVEKYITEGAAIIDVGALSSKPGAVELPIQEEIRLLNECASDLPLRYPEMIFSIDSYRKEVVEHCLDQGWHIINDITGTQNSKLIELAVLHNAPYIAMHMQGSPRTMQDNPIYGHVTEDILRSFILLAERADRLNLKDLIIDPGFGFGKTIKHNYQLLQELEAFNILDLPILVGISRKSMIYKLLGSSPEESINGTTALHMIALHKGASILRVHDVAAAQEAIILHNALSLSKI